MDVSATESGPGMTPVKYRHSGKLGRAPLLYLVLVVVMFAIPSYLYGLVSSGIMYMKAKILIMVLIGMGLGWATAWLGQTFRCRSTFWVTLVAAFGTAAGVYVGVAVFMETIFASGGAPLPPQFQTRAMLADPSLWWSKLQTINGAGYYAKYNTPVTGWELWIDWGFELVFFCGGAIGVAFAAIRSKAYCEDCGKWLELKKSALRFVPPADKALRKRVESGDLAPILGLPDQGATAAAGPHFRLDYVLCKDCGNMGTYRIISVTPGAKNPESNLSSLMLLTHEAAPILGLMLENEKPGAAPPASPPKPESPA